MMKTMETDALINGIPAQIDRILQRPDIFDVLVETARGYAARLGTTLPQLGYSAAVLRRKKMAGFVNEIRDEMGSAERLAEDGWIESFDDVVAKARKHAELSGKTLSSLGYSEEKIKKLETKVLTKAIEEVVRTLDDDNIRWFDKKREEIQTYADRLGSTLEELGHEQTIKNKERKALSKAFVAVIEDMMGGAHFEDKEIITRQLARAKKYADRMNMTPSALLGPRVTGEIKKMAHDRGIKNVNALLGLKSGERFNPAAHWKHW